jgi:methyl-accepting chemotaxis protein
MRIRSKMFMLVSSAMAFMVIIAAIYLFSQASSGKIEAERRVLLGLNDSVKDLIGAINLLDSGQIDSSEKRFLEKKAAADAAFDAAGKLTYIPKVNAALKDSIEIINNLRALASDDLASLTTQFSALKADEAKFFLSTRETTLRQFYTDEYARKKYDLKDVYKRLEDFTTLSAGLTDTLIMSSDVIGEKNILIDKELAAAQARSLVITLAIGAVLVALALLIAFRFSRSLAKPIVSIERTIKSLGTGDLRERAAIASKDELGILGANLNSFLDSLSSSIGEIQSVARENDELKRNLIQALSGASSSATEIDANAASIKRQVEGLDAKIGGAREALSDMGKGIFEYAERVTKQDEMIGSSSASMEEVIASMNSIGSIAEGDRAAADSLVKATAESRVVFGETFEGLSAIARSVEDINEMARVIQEIASRTNLLAMNAAIEAAHAGESGKGFAVVADEIRKLASAASESSKQIGDTIRSVGEKMAKASDSRDRASSSFKVMDAQIVRVTASASEIDRLLGEIRVKAQAVLGSMRELGEASKSTAQGSAAIESAAVSVDGAVAEAARVSQEVRANIAEIVAGLGEISTSVQDVSGLAGKLGEAGARLDSAVNAFTTGQGCSLGARPSSPRFL